MRSKTLTSFFPNTQGSSSKKSNVETNELSERTQLKSRGNVETGAKLHQISNNRVVSRQDTPFEKTRRLKTVSREQNVISALETERVNQRNSPLISSDKMVTYPALDPGSKLIQMSIERTRTDLFENELQKRSLLIGENNLRRDVSHHLDAMDFYRKRNIFNEKKKFTPIVISQTEAQVTLPDINRCSSPWELRSLNTVKMTHSQSDCFRSGASNSALVQEGRNAANSPTSLVEGNREFNQSREGGKRFPISALNSLPSGRMEAKILKKWVDMQREVIEKELNDTDISKREKVRQLLNLVFREIVREVKIECNERGELLEKLWSEDQGLWDKLDEYLNKKLTEGTRKNEKACERIHEFYKRSQEKNDELLFKLQKENIFLKDELQKTKERLDHNIKLYDSKMNKMNLYKQAFLSMKKTINSLKEMNERLLIRAPEHFRNQHNSIRTDPAITFSKEKSFNEEESESEIMEQAENDQLGRELNRIAIISLPEKQKVIWQQETESQVEADLREAFIRTAQVQTELNLVGTFFDKGLENNKIVKDMITDYHYKKDVEKLASSVEDIQGTQADNGSKKKKSVSFSKEEQKRNSKKDLTNKLVIRDPHRPSQIEMDSDGSGRTGATTKQSPKYNEAKLITLETLNSLPLEKVKEEEKENPVGNPEEKSAEELKTQQSKEELEKDSNQAKLEEALELQKQASISKSENIPTESSEDVSTPRDKIENFNQLGEIVITPALETIDEGEELEPPFTPINPQSRLKIRTSIKSNLFGSVSPIIDPLANRKSYINKGSFSIFAGKAEQRRSSLTRRGSSSKLTSEPLENNHIELPSRIRSISLKNRVSTGEMAASADLGKLRKSFSRSSGLLLVKSEDSYNEQMPSELYFNSEKEVKEGNATIINNPWRNEFLRVMKIFKAETLKANNLEGELALKDEDLQIEREVRHNIEIKYNELNELYENLLRKYESIKLIKDQQDSEKVNEILADVDHISANTNEITEHDEQQLDDDSKAPRKSSQLNKHLALNQKGIRFDYLSHNKDIALNLLEKVVRNKMKKFTSFLPVKQLLKQINIIYEEREALSKENTVIREQPLYLFAFNCLLSIYGFRKITEQKFLVFLLSLRKHSSIYRVNMFSRFIGLMEEKNNMSLEEFSKYIEAKSFMTYGSSFGYTITNSDTEPRYYVPFIRVLQYSSIFSEKLLNKQKFQELRKEIELLKEDDPRKKNKAGIIDFDQYMNLLLNAFRLAINSMRNYIRIAFSACDFDCNGRVSLDEYILIVRYVEQPDEESAFEELFSQQADVKFDDEFYMSFDRFVITCVDYSLFTEEKQNSIIGKNITYSEMKLKFKEVSGAWVIDRIHLDQKFPNLDVITKLEADIWLNRVETLERRIRDLDGAQENDEYWDKLKSVLISHHIIMKEMERLQELQVKFEDEKDDMEDIEFEEDDENDNKLQRPMRHYKTETLFTSSKNQHRTGQVFDPNISELLKNSDAT